MRELELMEMGVSFFGKLGGSGLVEIMNLLAEVEVWRVNGCGR